MIILEGKLVQFTRFGTEEESNISIIKWQKNIATPCKTRRS